VVVLWTKRRREVDVARPPRAVDRLISGGWCASVEATSKTTGAGTSSRISNGYIHRDTGDSSESSHTRRTSPPSPEV